MVSTWKISTGLKDTIGKELITKAQTTIFELVKNAYDANATRVDIVFQKGIIYKSTQPRLHIHTFSDNFSVLSGA